MKRCLMIAMAVFGAYLVAETASAYEIETGSYTKVTSRSYPTSYGRIRTSRGSCGSHGGTVYVQPAAPRVFVTPAPLAPACPKGLNMTPGRTYTLKGNFFEERPGQVVLFTGSGLSHACTVLSWSQTEVTFVVPNMGVSDNGSYADLRITRPDGQVVGGETVRLINPPHLIEHADAPATASPGQVGLYIGESLPQNQIGG